jgi:tetratricopeptide (TPR) repeat protein
VGLLLSVAALPSFASSWYVAAGTRQLQAGGDVAQAVRLFEHARNWSPTDPEIERALARAYVRLGQPEAAIAALEQAYRIQPEGLLIRQELAQAYEAAGQLRRADGLWASLGMTPDSMTAMADELFEHRQFVGASDWYARAMRSMDQVGFEQLFKRAIAATIARNAQAVDALAAVHEYDPTFALYELREHVRIPGSAFRWITAIPSRGLHAGMPLTYGVPAESSRGENGYLWWSGEALAVFNVEHEASYRLNIHALASKPAPVVMAFGVDGQQLRRVLLTSGDDTWATLTFNIRLAPGAHTVHIWFLNDEVVGGVNRDAVIQSVEIHEEQ